ncbi:MAG: patatin-like phospholipase family protein [Luteibacter sp.]
MAFSGGGIRSAAFSIGVMQGLNDAGLLQSADVMSSTSGGAYAASWLYMATRNRGISIDDALNPTGEEQARLSKAAPNFVDSFWGVWSVATGAISEALFTKVAKDLSCRAGYDPSMTPSGGSFAYVAALKGFLYDWEDAAFLSVARGVNGPKLPELVIGVSVTDGSSPSCGVDKQKSRAAELSASGLKVKSEIYRDDIDTWKLSNVVASAGGATDMSKSDNAGFTMCRLPTLFRPLLGSAICTPSRSGVKETFITDGGFTDNLALEPAIQRRCKVIVSVDATHDPSLEFKDLAIALEKFKEDGWTIGALQRQISSPGTGDAFTADMVKSMVAIDTSRDGSTFAYIKLSLPGDVDTSLPSTTLLTHEYSKAKYSMPSGCTAPGIGNRCRFPQESTMRQGYLVSEFMAYRDLGHWAVEYQLIPKLHGAAAIEPASR